MRNFPIILIACSSLVACDRTSKQTDLKAEESTSRSRHSASHESDPALKEQRAARDSRRKALKSATGLPTTEERNKELAKVAWDSLELDPETAQDAFEQLIPGSEEKNKLLEHMALRKAGEDIEAAKKWAASLETEEERSLAYGNIAIALAETEPEAAAALLSAKIREGRNGEVAVTKVAQRWAVQSPRNAADWMLQFKPGDQREAGIKAVLSSWSIGDPKSTELWIADLPTEALRKEAIKIYAEISLDQPKIGQDLDTSAESQNTDSRLEDIQNEIRAQSEKIDQKREIDRARESVSELE